MELYEYLFELKSRGAWGWRGGFSWFYSKLFFFLGYFDGGIMVYQTDKGDSDTGYSTIPKPLLVLLSKVTTTEIIFNILR